MGLSLSAHKREILFNSLIDETKADKNAMTERQWRHLTYRQKLSPHSSFSVADKISSAFADVEKMIAKEEREIVSRVKSEVVEDVVSRVFAQLNPKLEALEVAKANQRAFGCLTALQSKLDLEFQARLSVRSCYSKVALEEYARSLLNAEFGEKKRSPDAYLLLTPRMRVA